ncbi:MAG: hypothetical protein CBC35_01415 [Planctomycetes bacterium TMED75]|nr:hypothetical protein [Porticoccaceae bacterium]OUU96354.1 MAG: hypothetical protein CBC35_01415 [Planctomycetes bacterium TMED75]
MIDEQQSARDASYVLVTPVRNEEFFVGRTIQSVVNQTIRPLEWVIVSDGSTDNTDTIVKEATNDYSWIRLIQLPERKNPSFAAVVENTTLGIDQISVNDYRYLGLLDSDLEFQSDYFKKLIEEFDDDPKLGLAGGVAIDVGLPRDVFPRNRKDVPGALQFFRKSCFQSIGSLIAVPEGGWDCLTCAVARKNGFTTKLVTSLVVDHLKPRNVSKGGKLRRIWQMGIRDYALGYHPLFEFVKCLGKYRISPPLLGAFLWWLGYCQAALQRRRRRVPDEIIKFTRNEQLIRLRRALGISK